MNNFRRERRCELAGEWSDRHFNLVRWEDTQSVDAKSLCHANGQEIYEARNLSQMFIMFGLFHQIIKK